MRATPARARSPAVEFAFVTPWGETEISKLLKTIGSTWRDHRRSGVISTMTLVAMLLLLGVLGFFVTHEVREARSAAAAQSARRSREAASALDSFLDTMETLLRTLAAQPAVKVQDVAAVSRVLAEVLKTETAYVNLWAANAAGWIYAYGTPPPGQQPTFVGDRSYFREATATGGMYVESLPDSRNAGRSFAVVMAFPVKDETGRVNGIVGVTFELLPTELVFGDLTLPPGSVITVIDTGGYVVARSVDAEDWVGRRIDDGPFWKTIRQAPSASFTGHEVTGSAKYVNGYRAVQRAPWRVVVSLPVANVYDEIWPNHLLSLALLVGVWAAMVALILRLSGAAGERSRLVADLESKAAQVHATFTAAADGMVLYDQSGRILCINPAAQKILDYAPPEAHLSVAERLKVLVAETPNGEPFPVEEFPAARAFKGETVGGVVMSIRPHGKGRLWISVSAAPMRAADGTLLGVVSTFTDITSLCQLQLERELLLDGLKAQTRELAHAISAANQSRVVAEQQAAELKALLANMAEGVEVLDRNGRILLQNRKAAEITGATASSGRSSFFNSDLRVLCPDGSPLAPENLPPAQLLMGREVTGQELVLERPDGQRRRVSINGDILKDASGVLAAIITFHDVTELRQLEQAKDEFLQVLAHELRNPLAAASGLVQLTIRRLGPDSVNRMGEPLRLAHGELNRLNVLINDIITGYRVSSGRLPLNLEIINLADVLTEATAPYRLSDPSGHEVQVTMPPLPHIPVMGDANRLAEVMTNLLSNATKYSPADTPIKVVCTLESDHVRIRVEDEGIGIPPDQLERVFDGFYRATNIHNRQPGGIGLGLYISRDVARRHGGELWAENRAGGGTVMTLRLPLALAAAGVAGMAEE